LLERSKAFGISVPVVELWIAAHKLRSLEGTAMIHDRKTRGYGLVKYILIGLLLAGLTANAGEKVRGG
jgi:hypothetical protein